MTKQELITFISNLSPEELNELDAEKLVLYVQYLLEDQEDQKIYQLLSQLKKNALLEAVGEHLPSEFIISVLEQMNKEQKLLSLLIGMNQETFEEMLKAMPKNQLEILKHDAYSEAVQHHLLELVHTLQQENITFVHKLNAAEAAINAIDPQMTTKQEILDIIESLESCRKAMREDTEKINQALSIAWSTGNLEIIEKITAVHTSLQRILKDVIGSDAHPSGLFSLLEVKLGSVYGDAEHDDEPAIEGLAKLSVWYLEDYLEIGLLQSTANTERFFELAKDNLQKIGLITVKDLKKANIFSKPLLKDYIQSNKNILN